MNYEELWNPLIESVLYNKIVLMSVIGEESEFHFHDASDYIIKYIRLPYSCWEKACSMEIVCKQFA